MRAVAKPAVRRTLRRRADQEVWRRCLGLLDARFAQDREYTQDPVAHVRAEIDSREQEIVGLVAALFAYGRVDSIHRTLVEIRSRLGPSPRRTILSAAHLQQGFGDGFRYRFNNGTDLVALLEAIATAVRRDGTLGESLARHRREARDLPSALASWIGELKGHAARAPRPSDGFGFLLPDPRNGGACKRLWLFLRWMIRPRDAVDLGTWSHLFLAEELLVPLDAHWTRIGPRLGFTQRRTPSLAMARDLTDALRAIDSVDPLRFDFAICHLGISRQCPPRLLPSHCANCFLASVCRTGRRHRAKTAP